MVVMAVGGTYFAPERLGLSNVAGALWLSCWARALGLFIHMAIKDLAEADGCGSALTQAPGLGLMAEKWSRCGDDGLLLAGRCWANWQWLAS